MMSVKDKFKKSFSYTWYFYLFALVLPIVAFPLAFSFMHRPLSHEKLNLFISENRNSDNKDSLDSKIYNDLKQQTNIRQAETIYCNYLDSIYLEKLTVVGYNTSDIILLPDTMFNVIKIDDGKTSNMQEINSNIIEELRIENETFYVENNKKYGVLLKDSSPIKNFYSINNDEKLYAFINANSSNIGEYSIKQPNSKNAFTLLKYVIG